MSIFTYHIPQDAVYNASDMVNILNNNYRHSVLAQNHGAFYSLGTITENFTLPAVLTAIGVNISSGTATAAAATTTLSVSALFSLGLFGYALYDLIFKDKPANATISNEPSNCLINGHFALDSSNNWYYYQEPGAENEIFKEVFTPKEVGYLLNTHDIWNTLNHNVPESYVVPLNGESYYNSAVLDA